jgi:hypothetical protein
MQNSYEIIDKWVSHKISQLKEDKIGLIISLVNNGVFPGLSVSKAMNLPLSFFTTEHGQIFLPHSKQVNSIVSLSKTNQSILLCFDHVSKKNQGDILAAQKFLTDFNADYKTLTITQDKDINVKIDYCFNMNEIKENPPEDLMAKFQNRNFI